MTSASVIWSASFCEQEGVKADWSEERQSWVCPVHDETGCVKTFRNIALLDDLAGRAEWEAEHPPFPSQEEIRARRAEIMQQPQVYHVLNYWIEQALTRDQWIELDSRIEAVFDEMDIPFGGTAGPIPE